MRACAHVAVPQRVDGNLLRVGLLAVLIHLLIKGCLAKVVAAAQPDHPLGERLDVERLQTYLPNCARAANELDNEHVVHFAGAMECRGVLVYSDGSVKTNCAADGAITGKRYFPAIDEFGYRRVQIKKQKYGVGQLVLEAYGPPRPSPRHTVDHINRDRSDNSIVNLRWATRSEQSSNRNSFDCSRNPSGRLIEYRKIGTAEWIRCAGCRAAGNIVGGGYQNIHACITGRQKTAYGYEFRAVDDQPDLDGEEWLTIDGITVSNHGRVLRRGKDKFTPVPAGGQLYAAFSGKKVHILVCRAFHGEAPQPNLSVDHINRIRSDNRSANLRWATKSVQTSNRSV